MCHCSCCFACSGSSKYSYRRLKLTAASALHVTVVVAATTVVYDAVMLSLLCLVLSCYVAYAIAATILAAGVTAVDVFL